MSFMCPTRHKLVANLQREPGLFRFAGKSGKLAVIPFLFICLFAVLHPVEAGKNFGPFGLGKTLIQLKAGLGNPVARSVGFLPPGPTFRLGDYYVGFGFSDPHGPAELVYVYRRDGKPLSEDEVLQILQANQVPKKAAWIPSDSVPCEPLNILRKESFRTSPGNEWWALHIASKRQPPAFQPALLIMSDGFVRGMARSMER